jgi:uncharacterized membrane protein
VLLMIAWHASDAWTQIAARRSAAFGAVLLLGGFAAPLFLWLAGLGVGMSATRQERTGRSRERIVAALCRRGLEIFILAFLFRIQAFIVSPGSHPITIFRVDILNIMGPAIVAAALVWAAASTTITRVLWYGALATLFAMLTPVVRTAAIVDSLPLWFQWYVRPAGDMTPFTLFPWAGFVLAGAASGVILSGVDDPREERRVQFAFAGVGLVLLWLGLYMSGRSSIYEHAEFWTSSPTWFAIRVGVMMMLVAALFGVGEISAGSAQPTEWRWLARLGQSSLFVYWIHVELVYGYATWLLRQRLPVEGAIIAATLFTVLIYQLVILRDRIVESWRARPCGHSAPETATV